MQKKHGITRPIVIYREAEIAALLKDAGFSNAEVTQSLFRNIKATAQRLWQLTRRLPKLLPLLRLALVAYKRACDHDSLSAGFLVPAIGWVREAGEERAETRAQEIQVVEIWRGIDSGRRSAPPKLPHSHAVRSK
jgi:hypothetical protein